MEKTIIWDIDGILGLPLESYAHAIPLAPGLELFNAVLKSAIFGETFNIIILTHRPEYARSDTLDWLRSVFNFSDFGTDFINSKLFMRADDDSRPAAEYKKSFIQENFIDINEQIICAFDDDPAVVDMYRSMGITVYQAFNKRE